MRCAAAAAAGGRGGGGGTGSCSNLYGGADTQVLLELSLLDAGLPWLTQLQLQSELRYGHSAGSRVKNCSGDGAGVLAAQQQSRLEAAAVPLLQNLSSRQQQQQQQQKTPSSSKCTLYVYISTLVHMPVPNRCGVC